MSKRPGGGGNGGGGNRGSWGRRKFNNRRRGTPAGGGEAVGAAAPPPAPPPAQARSGEASGNGNSRQNGNGRRNDRDMRGNRNRRRGPQRRAGGFRAPGGGGIRAQTKGSRFGENWWARRWIEVLESFEMGSRLNRGRDYAKSGHVLAITIDEGHVHARVRGSRPKPYDVDINIGTIPEEDWTRVGARLAEQAVFSATLLAGEMPGDIEEIFEELGLSLYPKNEQDLVTSCTCPDTANPCKHLAAVYLLLGEEFDRDPFLLFTMRGMRRDKLLAIIEKNLPQALDAEAQRDDEEIAPVEEPKQALQLDPDIYWKGAVRMPEDAMGDVAPPAISAALPRRLGPVPLLAGAEDAARCHGARV
jgi:uncharacterized Zn finger protein